MRFYFTEKIACCSRSLLCLSFFKYASPRLSVPRGGQFVLSALLSSSTSKTLHLWVKLSSCPVTDSGHRLQIARWTIPLVVTAPAMRPMPSGPKWICEGDPIRHFSGSRLVSFSTTNSPSSRAPWLTLDLDFTAVHTGTPGVISLRNSVSFALAELILLEVKRSSGG